MSNSTCAIVSMVVGAAALIFSSRLFYFKAGSRQKRFVEKAKRQGHVVQARAGKVKFHLGTHDRKDSVENRSNTTEVKYEYVVDGVTYTQTFYFTQPGMSVEEYPSKITLYYDPRKPQKAITEPDVANARSQGCGISLVVTFLSMLAAYHLCKFVFGA